jgi:LPXTG-motif cell wall-anchored protein
MLPHGCWGGTLNRPMRRALLLLSFTALLAGATVLPAVAGGQDPEYPPADSGITLRDSDGNITAVFFRGENGTVDASGLIDNTTYDSKFSQSPGVVIGTGESDGDGRISDSFRIPTNARLGGATFFLDPRGTDEGDIGVAIRVVGAGDADDDGVTLPKTGSRIDQYIGIGAGLIVIGAILVALVRRRRGSGKPPASDRELANA